MLVLLLAGLLGAMIAFGGLLPFGLLFAIPGAIVSGAVCIGLAGAWLASKNGRGEEKDEYSDGPGGSGGEPPSGWRAGDKTDAQKRPSAEASVSLSLHRSARP